LYEFETGDFFGDFFFVKVRSCSQTVQSESTEIDYFSAEIELPKTRNLL